ncbi:Translocase of outer mitochondrial membrane complex, subunit TOM37/Metaxin 1 [Handroanthus impetiginosus]|uniref:Translocase of outer mitochondrial membrane complex, subunit TOM37/Metaxin 1 n=1 Tax=Handroanthus impetiginosus TaxID=429701 RepID=A0A2G9GT29_9LAMI|nr:Translocase of outer mitochondrial membrane complex, subunit TOM37/Metaxin 1 [Handroanthus impetiginosus]
MEDGSGERGRLTLVVRKPCFGLPTACPKCLPVYIYLKFSKIPFSLDFNLRHPDSDQIPFAESGDYVAYNNEKGGVIKSFKEDGIVDLDGEVNVMYELWVGSDGKSAQEIYYSDLPWPIGKILYFKQVRTVKQLLGITADNAERREEEIYSRATLAYGALSSRLGEQTFLFEDRPTSLDAVFLGHVLFTLHALPETSVLKSKLLGHANLVNYAENLKMEYVDANTASSSVPQSDPSSSASRRGPSNWSSKPRSKPRREKTEEEKKFRRRAKYFLATQFVAILVFLSLLSGSNDAEVELEDDDDGLNYE